MPKPAWQEHAEQWGGHFIGLGIIMTSIFGFFAVAGALAREFTDWRLPWPYRGQWPPGDVFLAVRVDQRSVPANQAKMVAPLDRVRDMAKDLTFTMAGCVIGLYIHMYLIRLAWRAFWGFVF